MADATEMVSKSTVLLRMQAQMAFQMLEGVMQGVNAEQLHWVPPEGIANPIAAQYAHVVLGKDSAVHHMFKGEQPLYASTWADRHGLSELPPPRSPETGRLPDWSEWARRVRMDLPAFNAYAQAVYASIDAYLASLDDAAMERMIDLSSIGMGERKSGFVLSMILLGDTFSHCGEISCLKGLQGLKGYPF